jgi:hypothetical protein
VSFLGCPWNSLQQSQTGGTDDEEEGEEEKRKWWWEQKGITELENRSSGRLPGCDLEGTILEGSKLLGPW